METLQINKNISAFNLDSPINPGFVLLPEFILTAGTIILLLCAVFLYRDNKHSMYTLNILNWFTYLLLATIFWLIINPYNKLEGLLIYNNLLIVDFYSFCIKLIILIGTVIILQCSKSYIKKEAIGNYEYPILLGFAVIGLLFLISSFDTFTMYMTIELLSLSLYILASFKTNAMYAAEAGIKYLTLGSLSSGILLFGMSMLYGNVVTMDFFRLKLFLIEFQGDNVANMNIGLIVGIIAIIIGFLFKISAVPFHMWAPDVYDGAPTPITFFFATVVKFGIFAFFLRLCFYLFDTVLPIWQNAILLTGVLSIIIGCLGAIFQDRIKRFAAYTSINHAGYLLLGVATGTFEGAHSVLFYLILYIITNLAFFTFLLTCQNSKTGQRIVFIGDLAGIGKSKPFLAFIFLVIMFSMAGVPPLAGFFSKYYLFLGLIHCGFNKIALFGIITSVISTFYYIRLTKITFFDTPRNSFEIDRIPFVMSYVLVFIFIFIITYFLSPSFLLIFTQNIAHSLISTFSFSMIF